tara:strand:+ start:79 stop:312 length:234 start_codon:yes stop_codon:yes gene_type:complete
MAINRSNINLQLTRGNKMFKGNEKKLREGDRLIAKQYGGKVMKRAGGGMSYQLYGGTSKNIRDGNTEVSQFYDKGGN